jgi:RNA polymerase sigma-70 factor, ECF subfamily
MIVTYARRLLGSVADAEDVAQETFLRAWQKADTYQPRARARTWLLAMTHNLAIDRLRRHRVRREESSEDEDQTVGPSSQEPAELLLRKMTALEVGRALDALPERQKVALLLAHEQGLSGLEIAEVLATTPEAIESLLARGRRNLRALLSANRNESDSHHEE